MHIYRDEAKLAAVVARMISEALKLHQPALVIASSTTRSMVARELEARGFDVPELERSHRSVLLDSTAMLGQLLAGGFPDAHRFNAQIPPLLARLCGTADLCIPFIYSDMADLLLREGNRSAAISLEILWSRLAMTHTFSLMCGYAARDFDNGAPTWEELQAICEQHNTVQRPPD